jgi:protein FrlC
MLSEIKSPRLYGMLDTAVLGYSGEEVKEVIETLGKSLRHIHFADGIPNGHLVLGEGDLDLRYMLQSINEAGYEYAISLEIMNGKYVEDPERAMKVSFEWLRREIKELA